MDIAGAMANSGAVIVTLLFVAVAIAATLAMTTGRDG